ncbi:hypothetical protein O3Q52_05890 [Streptomyces sp. ActVer]|uniref:hypothetical protein n=1 Tax=Streptomyces sp. ActVer TaxID=3014558 RepID=UPI0022B51140|nr:hypothetical protein [Streptomyces sp. ActVer]MCZ4507747.1 hypothetical protein [Streptomyces sp. ActVer]
MGHGPPGLGRPLTARCGGTKPVARAAQNTAADGIEPSAEQLAELGSLTLAADDHHDGTGTRLLGR